MLPLQLSCNSPEVLFTNFRPVPAEFMYIPENGADLGPSVYGESSRLQSLFGSCVTRLKFPFASGVRNMALQNSYGWIASFFRLGSILNGERWELQPKNCCIHHLDLCGICRKVLLCSITFQNFSQPDKPLAGTLHDLSLFSKCSMYCFAMPL